MVKRTSQVAWGMAVTGALTSSASLAALYCLPQPPNPSKSPATFAAYNRQMDLEVGFWLLVLLGLGFIVSGLMVKLDAFLNTKRLEGQAPR